MGWVLPHQSLMEKASDRSSSRGVVSIDGLSSQLTLTCVKLAAHKPEVTQTGSDGAHIPNQAAWFLTGICAVSLELVCNLPITWVGTIKPPSKKKKEEESRKMAQWLGMLAALAENPSWVLGTHISGS